MTTGTPRALASKAVRGAQAGFTLVEVAVASFVLVFSLASTIIALQTGFKSMDVARGITLASQIAQSEIERIRLLNWSPADDPVGEPTTGREYISTLPATATVDVAGTFITDPALAARFTVTRTVSVDSADTRTNADLIRVITISVNWKTLDGMVHTRNFRTIYAKNGLYDYFHVIAHN